MCEDNRRGEICGCNNILFDDVPVGYGYIRNLLPQLSARTRQLLPQFVRAPLGTRPLFM